MASLLILLDSSVHWTTLLFSTPRCLVGGGCYHHSGVCDSNADIPDGDIMQAFQCKQV